MNFVGVIELNKNYVFTISIAIIITSNIMSYSARVIRKLKGRDEIFSQFSSDEEDEEKDLDHQVTSEAFSNKFAMVRKLLALS